MIDFKWKHGELSIYERKLLYSFVKRFKPNIVLEIGTGFGGSSYFILNALRESSNGMLYTCDSRRSPCPALYKEFQKSLKFYKIKSEELIEICKRKKIRPDFIFFDGPDEPEIALNDFMRLEGFVNAGTVFSMHDWGEQADKAKLLKPYLKSLDNWKIIFEPEVNQNIGDDYTVGIVFAQKIS